VDTDSGYFPQGETGGLVNEGGAEDPHDLMNYSCGCRYSRPVCIKIFGNSKWAFSDDFFSVIQWFLSRIACLTHD
jgi:hypothetical protein